MTTRPHYRMITLPVFLFLHLLRLAVRLEVGTISAIVFAVEDKTTLQRGSRNGANQQERKHLSEKACHVFQIYERSVVLLLTRK